VSAHHVVISYVACDALLDLRHAPRHLGVREVLVSIVYRLELAAVDHDASAIRPMIRHSATKREQTLRMAAPFSLRALHDGRSGALAAAYDAPERFDIGQYVDERRTKRRTYAIRPVTVIASSHDSAGSRCRSARPPCRRRPGRTCRRPRHLARPPRH
jgi:hypothetical protein